jgi:hypothetical protein
MPTKRRRPEIVAVQLTGQEKSELTKAAEAMGLPVSVFVRMGALTRARGEVKAA